MISILDFGIKVCEDSQTKSIPLDKVNIPVETRKIEKEKIKKDSFEIDESTYKRLEMKKRIIKSDSD